MEQEEIIPTPELKRQALCRRADKLLTWLQREEYANYVDSGTTDHLLKLVDLVIWAFEMSLPKEDWTPLLEQFKAVKDAALEVPDDDKSDASIYNNALQMLSLALLAYKEFVGSYLK